MEVERQKAHSRASLFVVHGETIYVSGLTPKNPEGNLTEQTRNVLKRIDEILLQAGSSKSKILLATIYLKNIDDCEIVDEIWDSWVDKDNLPCRVKVESRLTSPQFLIDIAIIAAR
jgi:enamine deaminase RidA (YjgF/YER057c/UK114 family)